MAQIFREGGIWPSLEVIRLVANGAVPDEYEKHCCVKFLVFARWQRRPWRRFAVSVLLYAMHTLAVYT